MCKRCAYMETREELFINAITTLHEDVTGTEDLTIIAMIVDTETNQLSYFGFNDTDLVAGVEEDTVIPHFLWTVPIICNDRISPLAIKEAMDASATLPPHASNPREAFDYLNECMDKEHLVVAKNEPSNPVEAMLALMASLLDD